MTRVTHKPLSLYLRKRAQKLARAHARPAEETFVLVMPSDWQCRTTSIFLDRAEQRVISVYRMGRETASDTQYWLAMPITVDFTATLSAGDAERTYDVTLPALDGGAK